MTLIAAVVFLMLGFTGGFFSGLLGIGGGLVLVPLLLYIPSLVGVPAISMKVITGITMVQSLFGSFSGLLVHRKNHLVHTALAIYMGGTSVVTALLGAIISSYLRAQTLTSIFAMVTLVATFMIFLPKEEDEDVAITEVTFNIYKSCIIATIVGFLSGILGLGGGFVLIPAMIYLLKIPTKVALASSLAITCLSSTAGFIGKLSMGGVPLNVTVLLVVGSIIGAQVGSYISARSKAENLRALLGLMIAGIALNVWFRINIFMGYLLLASLLGMVSLKLTHIKFPSRTTVKH